MAPGGRRKPSSYDILDSHSDSSHDHGHGHGHHHHVASASDLAAGYITLVLVIIAWTSYGELTHHVELNGFYKPTFLTATGSIACIGIGSAYWFVSNDRKAATKDVMLWSCLITCFATASKIIGNMSLYYTNPTLSLALYQAVHLIVDTMGSSIFHPHDMGWLKYLAIGMSLCGILSIELSPKHHQETTMYGMMLSCLSGALGGCVVVTFKLTSEWHFPDDRFGPLFFVFMYGVVSFLITGFLMIGADENNIEPFELPVGGMVGLVILVGLTIGFMNVFTYFTIHFIGGTKYAMGSLLVIPTTLVFDLFIRKITFYFLEIVGCILVSIGFATMHLEYQHLERISTMRGLRGGLSIRIRLKSDANKFLSEEPEILDAGGDHPPYGQGGGSVLPLRHDGDDSDISEVI